MFRGKNLESLGKSDLENLISDKIGEGQRIEYKSQMYANNQKIEMLKDITAMTNAEGGYLILGISENGDGFPQALLGIVNGEDEKDKILQSCHSSIEDKILGLSIKVVDIGSSKSVLIISIPRSSRKPHMVTFEKHSKFYIRHDRHNLPMSLNEIRGAILAVEDYMNKHVQFLDSRKDLIKKRPPHLVIAAFFATPLMIGKDVIDPTDKETRELLIKPNFQEYGLIMWLHLNFVPQVRPTLYGLIAENGDRSKGIELLRNGHTEMKIVIEKLAHLEDGRPYISDRYLSDITGHFMTFIDMVKKIYVRNGINLGLSFSLGLYNIKGSHLVYKSNHLSDTVRDTSYSEQYLEIPGEIVDDIEEIEPDRIAKTIMDRVYNAFGEENSPDFDKNGKFIVRTKN